MWPEIPPPDQYESGIEELTGVRPYKGTLMYYRTHGIYDPYEAEEAPEPHPGQRTSDIIYYLEQSHHDHQNARHTPSHTLLGQRVQAQSHDTFRSQAPRRGGKRHQGPRPEQSRELIGPPRPGRATELFLQGRARADHHIVDESNVCPTVSRGSRYRGPKFSLKKSPWSAASESALGDPRDAFVENRPPPAERLHRQPAPKTRLHAPATKPLPGYVEMDYARPPGQFRQPHHQQQPPIRTSDQWKGGAQPRLGEKYKRFHGNVIPYETDFNRKPVGWQSNYVHEDPTDFIFPQDDLDSWGSPSFAGGGSGGNRPPAQYGDYNPRPTAWGGGEEEEDEPYVPLSQRKAAFQQPSQQAYHQPQQHHHQPQQHHRQPQQHHHQQPQRAHHQRPPQHRGGRGAPRHAPGGGRGSAAYSQPHYAGPQHQQAAWGQGGGGLMESDDL